MECEGLPKITARLNRKTDINESSQFEVFTDEEYEAIKDINKVSAFPSIPALKMHRKRCIPDANICRCQVGFFTSRGLPDGDRLVIGYWSGALTDAERNQTSTKK